MPDNTWLIIGIVAVMVILVVVLIWMIRRQSPDRAKEFNLAEQVRKMEEDEGIMMRENPMAYLAPSAPSGGAPRKAPITLPGQKKKEPATAESLGPGSRSEEPNSGAEKTKLTAQEPEPDELFDASAAASGATQRPVAPMSGLTGVKRKAKPSTVAAPKARPKKKEADDPFLDSVAPEDASGFSAAPPPPSSDGPAPPPPPASDGSAPPPPPPPSSPGKESGSPAKPKRKKNLSDDEFNI
jgi:hypothetical protein